MPAAIDTQKQPPGFASRHVDVAIMQPGYLPWLGYFDLVAMADIFVLYDDVAFDKGGWRNRNRVLGHPDPVWLTAPVRTSGRLGQSINDTALTEGTWPASHLKTIRQVYARAPFFDWCYPALDAYLGGPPHRRLVDLCIEGHRVLAGLLGLATPIRRSSELGHAGTGRTERLVAICADLGATRYIAADASRDYMDEAQWTKAGIALVYQAYPHPTYAQLGRPFQSHLSAIDALMFVGPDARRFVGISHPKERKAQPA